MYLMDRSAQEKCTRYPTEKIKFSISLSQFTDSGPTSPSADPIAPGGVATGVPSFGSLV